MDVRGDLLEREGELGVLDRSFAALRRGEAGVVLVEGPAGIGKSRVLAEARRGAEADGLRVLSARGGEMERDYPFGVVRQLFEPELVDPAAAERLLAGAAGGARPVFAHGHEAAGEPGGDTSFATLHGLYWLTLNLAGGDPLVLVVDDLHWCDRTSLRFLAYLVRRLEGSPLLLLGSLRPSEPGADAALLAELASDPLTISVRPGPLTETAVGALVLARLGDGAEPVFTAALHSSTGGNPLLASECLKALQAEGIAPVAANVKACLELGPRAAGRAVLVRLGRLPQQAVAVARSLAVVGDGADIAVVARLAEVDEPTAAAAIADLVRAEILRPDTPLGFVHPLVREAVRHELTPAERGLRHEQAARVLAELGAPEEQIAAQLLLAPARGDTTTVEILRAAARTALAKGAPDSAAASLARAADEPPAPELRPVVLAELGAAELFTSAPTSARHLAEAYRGLSDPVDRARVAEKLVRATIFAGDPDEAAVLARGAQADLPEDDDLRHRLEALELSTVFWGAGDAHEMRERLRSYRHRRPGGAGARMIEAIAAWGWTQDGGSADEVCALALHALEGGALLDADSAYFSVIAAIPLMLADRDEADTVLDQVRVDGYTRGSVFSILGHQLWAGYAELLRGDVAESESLLREAQASLTLWGVPRSAYTCAFLAETLLERGAIAEARAILETAEIPPATSDRALLLDRAHATLLLAEGRPQDAHERICRMPGRSGWPLHPLYQPWRSVAALSLDRLGRSDEARALAREEVDRARHWGSPGALGRALRILGSIERESGRAHVEEAVSLLEGTRARLELAKALAALGGRLRRDRQPSDAREPLRRALEIAESCGATALADDVRAEIHATGARPRTSALRGVSALTASERRVAGLAAGGQSNRDIAQTLYVTPKTVEVHLSSVYRKLGIGSRRELGRVLAPS